MDKLKALKKSEEDIQIETEQQWRDIDLNWWKKVRTLSLVFITLIIILLITFFFSISGLNFKPAMEFFGPLSSSGFWLGLLAAGLVVLIIFGIVFVLITYLIYILLVRLKTSNLSSNFINNSAVFYAILLSAALHITIWVPIYPRISELSGLISYIVPFYIELSLFVIFILLNFLLTYKNNKIGKRLISAILAVWLAGSGIMAAHLPAPKKRFGTNTADTSSAPRNKLNTLFGNGNFAPVIYKDKIYFIAENRAFRTSLAVSDLNVKNIKTIVKSEDVKNQFTGDETKISRIYFIVNDYIYFRNIYGEPFRVNINNPEDMVFYFDDIVLPDDLKAINDDHYKIIGDRSNAYTLYKNQIVYVSGEHNSKLYLGKDVIYKSEGFITSLGVHKDFVYIFDSERTEDNYGKIKKISLTSHEVIDSVALNISFSSTLKYSYNENGIVFTVYRGYRRNDNKNLVYKLDYTPFKLKKLDDFIGIENNTNVMIYNIYYIDKNIVYCTSSESAIRESTGNHFKIYVYDENGKTVREYKNIYYYQPYEKGLYLINSDAKIERIAF
ncbi:MAG: hypothetical protein LBR69_03950 [Endomicrobium sp.]|jgi:hypothetical protein|nr:hypothetical protein [Endomicrobium sp.]